MVMPLQGNKIKEGIAQVRGSVICKGFGDDIRMPNVYEAGVIFYNQKLLGASHYSYYIWTSTFAENASGQINPYLLSIKTGRLMLGHDKNAKNHILCVKR